MQDIHNKSQGLSMLTGCLQCSQQFAVLTGSLQCSQQFAVLTGCLRWQCECLLLTKCTCVPQTGGFLHASVVYCAWAVKLFWEGDPAAKKKREVTSTVRATTCVVEVLVHP